MSANTASKEVTTIASQEWLDKDTFLRLAKAAGLDVASPHIEELYPNVLNLLASLESLRRMDVSGAEPDMAFIPPRD